MPVHRNTVRAKQIKAELLAALGGKCDLCPETDEYKLEFDHIHGRDYNPNELSYLQRLNRYKREAKAGKIRILCEVCNKAERKKNENGSFCRTNETPLRTMELQEIVEEEI